MRLIMLGHRDDPLVSRSLAMLRPTSVRLRLEIYSLASEKYPARIIPLLSLFEPFPLTNRRRYLPPSFPSFEPHAVSELQSSLYNIV
jgi:hypothetical protein